jgi:Tol biopolymer transport system component
MTRTGLLAAAVTVVWLAAPLIAQSAATRFESARYKEHVEGDLVGAIAIYKDVAARKDAGRALSAQALLLAAQCYDKLGEGDSQVLYERIVREFGDQAEPVRQAQAALSRTRSSGRAGGGELGTRRVATFHNESWVTRRALVASDGHMAYVDQLDGKGNWTVVRRNLTTGEERTLYTVPAAQRSRDMVLSPDRSRLAISHSLQDGTSAIILLDTNGNTPRKIDSAPTETRPAAWSPDGKEMLVTTRRRAARPQLGEPTFSFGTVSLATIDVATGALRVIREIGHRDPAGAMILGAAYTSDGSAIVYDLMADDRERRVINLLSRSGNAHRTIVDGPGNSAVLGFAPGGSELLFLSDRSGSIDAYALPFRDGQVAGEARLVKDNVGLIRGAGWSGANLLYSTRLRRTVFVGTLDMQSGEIRDRREVSSRHVNTLFPALLSPDGSKLVYGSAPKPLADGRPSLVIRDMKSARERELELSPKIGWLTAVGTWSPDGAAIVLSGYAPTGEQTSARVDIKTGDIQVFSNKLCWEALADGTHILCESAAGRPGAFRLSTIDWRSGTETPVLAEAYGVHGRNVGSPDGKRLAFLSDGGAALAIRDLETSADRIIWRFPRPGARNSVGRWLDSGHVLVLHEREGKCCGVAVVPLEPSQVPVAAMNWDVDWADPRLLYPQPWPQLAFADSDRSLDLWVLENLPLRRSAKPE